MSTEQPPVTPPKKRGISPIKEEDTQHSESHRSLSRKSNAPPKSQTYSKADILTGASIHSYSELYESATRESIDETPRDIKDRISQHKRDSKNSITWTNVYTASLIDKNKQCEQNKIGWGELVNLEQLHQLQMISTIEYKKRKQQLIDNMTGTKVDIETEIQRKNDIDECKNPPQKRVLGETEIIKKNVNFNKVQTERAIRHSCHIKLIQSKDSNGEDKVETKEEWKQDMRIVKMAKNPFNNGTLRYVYYMQDIEHLNPTTDVELVNGLPIKNTATHVAKISIDPMEEFETYFHDVAMQKHAQRFADEFNKNEVPKKVGFLGCFVYELVDRTPHIFCGVEQIIHGDYHKYTNNWDWVNQTVDRNTPSAFSHFTYEASRKKILICDLQGVGDLYTDPQMHTYDGKGCGKGNMGKRGIEKFLTSHKCNAICTYLKLRSANLGSQFTGTVPQKRFMNSAGIDQVPVTNGQYTVPDTNGYGATMNDTKTGVNQQLLGRTFDDEESDSGEGGAFPFGKRLDDDKEETKCWCCIL